MAKLYSRKKQVSKKELLPSKTTVNLILSYSKALKIVRVGSLTFENLSN
ncbi:hypothetical protein [Flavobacterium indicum]|nr:hypothetical protein [Flavobacterium indicum]